MGAALLLAVGTACTSQPAATVAAPAPTTTTVATSTTPAPTGSDVPMAPTVGADLPTTTRPATTQPPSRGYVCEPDGTAVLDDGRSGYTAACVAEVGAATPRSYQNRISNRDQPTTDDNCATGWADPYACYLDGVPAPYNPNGGSPTPRCDGTACEFPDGSVIDDPDGVVAPSPTPVPGYQRCGVSCGEAPTSGEVQACVVDALPADVCAVVESY